MSILVSREALLSQNRSTRYALLNQHEMYNVVMYNRYKYKLYLLSRFTVVFVPLSDFNRIVSVTFHLYVKNRYFDIIQTNKHRNNEVFVNVC